MLPSMRSRPFALRMARITELWWWGFVTALVAIILSTLLLRPSDVLVTATLNTETFSFTPTNPVLSEISLPRGRVDVGQGAGPCIEDLALQLGDGARLLVKRSLERPEILSIILEGSARIVAGDGAIRELPSGAILDVSGDDPECAVTRQFRLALVGAMSVGASDGNDILSASTINVYGRASERILGFIPVAIFRSLEPGALFWAERLELPPGTALLCATRRKERGNPAAAAMSDCPVGSSSPYPELEEVQWWSFADVDLTRQDGGIVLEMAANANHVLFTSPAPADGGRARPEKLSPSLTAQIIGDPNLRLAFAVIAAVLGLASAVAQILSLKWARL